MCFHKRSSWYALAALRRILVAFTEAAIANGINSFVFDNFECAVPLLLMN